MVEFALVAMPLLFAGLFVIEAARWQMTRQMLSLALLEAARAGATAHGRPDAIEAAFETALLPQYQPPGMHADARARMRASFLRTRQDTGMAPWHIDILQPAHEVFTDFADRGIRVAGAHGLPAIRNDYQAEQHARRLGMGWREGRGPRSGMTIFHANTLRLRLTYLHAPLVPGIRSVLRALSRPGAQGPAAARAGMLTMVVELAVTMQSHPVDWSGRANKRTQPLAPGTSAVDPIRKLFPTIVPGSRPGMPAAVSAPRTVPSRAPLPAAGATAAPDSHADATSDMEDAACGVVLCCS